MRDIRIHITASPSSDEFFAEKIDITVGFHTHGSVFSFLTSISLFEGVTPDYVASVLYTWLSEVFKAECLSNSDLVRVANRLRTAVTSGSYFYDAFPPEMRAVTVPYFRQWLVSLNGNPVTKRGVVETPLHVPSESSCT